MAQSITDPKITTPDDPWTMTLDDPGALDNSKQGINDPKVPGPDAPVPIAGSTGPTATTPPPVGTDAGSQIDALYKQYGVTDAGRGGGFADRAYWLEHPSEVLNGRLGRDLAGTGTDQPTGTPGYGPWLNSGKNAPEASIGQPTRDAFGGGWNDPAAARVGLPTPGGSTDPGAGIPWTAGASAPSYAPPGFLWDPKQARFVLISELNKQIPPVGVSPGSPSGGGTVPPGLTVNYQGGGAGGVDPTDPFQSKP